MQIQLTMVSDPNITLALQEPLDPRVPEQRREGRAVDRAMERARKMTGGLSWYPTARKGRKKDK
jgi:hypothetical protein